MKKTTITTLFALIFLLSAILSNAQVLVTDDDNYTADASSMLDVKSTDAGLLIPRMTASQKGSINSPATGLLVFQTDGISGFYYNAGTPSSPNWIQLSSTLITKLEDADLDTKIQVEEISDEDKIRFDVNGIETFVVDSARVGIGTDSPTHTLHLKHNEDVSLLLEADTDNSGESDQPELIFSQDGGLVKTHIGYFDSENAFSIYETYGEDIQFLTDSTLRMTITGDGNLGIGTSNPQGKLHVSRVNTIDTVFDQSQTQIGNMWEYGYNIIQTFKPGVNGLLIKLSVYGLFNGSFNIYIREGNNPSTPILASKSFSVGSMNSWTDITFTSPASLIAGQTYNFYITSSSYFGVIVNYNNPYADGYFGYQGNYAYNEDMSFKTYVQTGHQDFDFICSSDGYIGIGTTTPSCPLEIDGYSTLSGSWGYLNSNGSTGTSSGNAHFSIKASDRIMASEFDAVSDKRIKTNIKNSNLISDLHNINDLRLIEYNYIDSISKGMEQQKGFIAQEVEQVLPDAVTKSSNYIPDIFTLATKLSRNKEHVIIEIQKEHQLQIGDYIRLITSTGAFETDVKEIISENSFAVALEEFPEKLFVYGRKVDDFRAIDYDYIFSTGIGAIQELSEEIETLKSEIDQLKLLILQQSLNQNSVSETQ